MVSRVILIRLFVRLDDAGKPRNLTENKLEISILEGGVYKVESVRPVWSKERKVSQNFLHFDL